MNIDKKKDYKLLALVPDLEENRVLIATSWVKDKDVHSIFLQQKISIKKFRDSYAIPIIEYFISVIKQEIEAGDCPIMSKFVNYMIKQNITPQEVFRICMGFRKSLIHFLLQQKSVLKNPLVLMEEVAVLFDANLSGVLDIFTTSYSQLQKKIEIDKVEKDKLKQINKIINAINTKIIIVQNDKIALVNKPFLEMIGAKNLNEFREKYDNEFEFLDATNVYQKDYENNSGNWIEKICKNKKYFKTNIYHSKIGMTLSYSGRITQLASKNSNKYIIALNNISEHIKEEQMLQDYLTHDGITGFKNYSAFEHLLITSIAQAKETKEKLFLTVLDIVNLREINTTQGREAGDRIIAEVAEDLRYVANKNIHLARLEGSRFGILMEYPSEQESYNWSVELHKKIKLHMCKQAISITEIDLSDTPNKLFLRAYSLLEEENSSSSILHNDFINILPFKDLENQILFTQSLTNIKFIESSIHFMELPLSAKVKVHSISKESIEIVLSNKQINITKIGMTIYLKFPKLGNIKASILEVNKDTNTVRINEFRKDTHSPLNRKSYRVKVDNIKAFITHNHEDFNVKVLNLNTKFIAIEVQRIRNLTIKDLVSVDMQFLDDKNLSFYKTNSTITRIDKVEKGYKIILFCHFSEANTEVLSTYISKQQIHIIQMLKNAS